MFAGVQVVMFTGVLKQAIGLSNVAAFWQQRMLMTTYYTTYYMMATQW